MEAKRVIARLRGVLVADLEASIQLSEALATSNTDQLFLQSPLEMVVNSSLSFSTVSETSTDQPSPTQVSEPSSPQLSVVDLPSQLDVAVDGGVYGYVSEKFFDIHDPVTISYQRQRYQKYLQELENVRTAGDSHSEKAHQPTSQGPLADLAIELLEHIVSLKSVLMHFALPCRCLGIFIRHRKKIPKPLS